MSSLPQYELSIISFVTLKAFYPLVLGVSSHYGMLIHTQLSISFYVISNFKRKTVSWKNYTPISYVQVSSSMRCPWLIFLLSLCHHSLVISHTFGSGCPRLYVRVSQLNTILIILRLLEVLSQDGIRFYCFYIFFSICCIILNFIY